MHNEILNTKPLSYFIKRAEKLWDESKEDMAVPLQKYDKYFYAGYAFNGGKLACITDDEGTQWFLIGPTDEDWPTDE